MEAIGYEEVFVHIQESSARDEPGIRVKGCGNANLVECVEKYSTGVVKVLWKAHVNWTGEAMHLRILLDRELLCDLLGKDWRIGLAPLKVWEKIIPAP
jgi:hypothetical protein